MISCASCGKSIPQDANFCVYCGAKNASTSGAPSTPASGCGCGCGCNCGCGSNGGCSCGCGSNGGCGCGCGSNTPSIVMVNDHLFGNLVLSILCCCVGFPFISWLGLLFSLFARSAKSAGDYTKAVGRAGVAKAFFWGQVVVGVLLAFVYASLVAFAGFAFVTESLDRIGGDLRNVRLSLYVNDKEMTPEQKEEIGAIINETIDALSETLEEAVSEALTILDEASVAIAEVAGTSDDPDFVISLVEEEVTNDELFDEDLVEEASVEEAPVEEAPVEEAPVEEAPVEEAPVEEAPAEEAPAEEAPAEEAPAEEAPAEEAPAEEAPAEEAPAEEAPVEEAPAEV